MLIIYKTIKLQDRFSVKLHKQFTHPHGLTQYRSSVCFRVTKSYWWLSGYHDRDKIASLHRESHLFNVWTTGRIFHGFSEHRSCHIPNYGRFPCDKPTVFNDKINDPLPIVDICHIRRIDDRIYTVSLFLFLCEHWLQR
jgi:hypothetical protein